MGLIAAQQKASVQPSQNVPQPQASPQTAGGEQPSPQEQADMDKVVMASLKVIYDQTTHQNIVDMLTQGKNDPAKALADTASLIITQVDKKSGGKVPEMVILPAATDVLDELAILATKARIFQVDDKIKAVAMRKMIADLAQKYGATPDQVKAFMDSVDPTQGTQAIQQQTALNRPTQPAMTPPTAQPAPQMGA